MTEAQHADGAARSAEVPAGCRAALTPYDRIGGEPAVVGVVEQFFELVLFDARLRTFFLDDANGVTVERVDLATIRSNFATLVATMLGASVRYDGRNLAEAHRNLGITASDYDRMGDLFLETLRFNDVPEDVACVVAEKVAALKPLIVEIVRSGSAVPHY